jgi:ubiquitin-conjugating enzyme E2 T
MNSGTLAPPAKNRITRELSQLSTDPPPGISCYAPEDNLTYLHSTITGPPDSPFESGIFLIAINIPNRYPFEPPKCRFVTPIHHPNIDSAGRICLDTLKSPPGGSWSPAVSLPSLLLSLRALMGEPNAEDGLVADVTAQFKSNYEAWFLEAKQLTEREATDAQLIEREETINASMNQSIDVVEERRIPRAFVRKGKENRDRSFNIMEQDESISQTVFGGKRKEAEVDAMVGNDRELKFKRNH